MQADKKETQDQTVPQTTTTENKPDSDQPKRERGPRFNPKEKNEDGENKDKKERQPRKPRFTPPTDWKEQLEKTVTVDTKIAPLPADTERVQRPNYNKLKNDLQFCEAEMDKHYRKIDALKEEQKKVRFEQRDKNSTLFDELKKLTEERKTYSNALAENKKLKQEYMDKINHIDDQLRAVEKKSFSGKTMRKKELMDMIKEKEEEFKNTKKTSAEEKKMSDEINRLRSMVKSIPEFEKLKDERQKYNDLVKDINKKNKEQFDKLSKLSDLITDIRVRLDETNLKIKQEQAEEKEKEKEGEKKKYVLSAAEQQLESIRQEHFDEIKKLKEKKQKLRDAYEKDWTDFEKQQFELDKIHFAQRIQKNLKRDEREKRRKEEDEKLKLQEGEKAKEMLQFKYHEEISLCESLASILEDLKPDRKTAKTTFENKEIIQHNVNQDQLKQENLVYIKPKKFDDSEVVVNKKKGKQQKNKKKEVPAASTETEKLNIHFDTLHLFNDVKVVPPTTVGQIDSVINQLNEKKNYYIQMREKEIAEAANAPVAEPKEGKEEGEEKKEDEEEPVVQRRDIREEDRQARNKKVADLKDDDFPEL